MFQKTSQQTIDSFRRIFGRLPQIVTLAPGRTNLIGEHTDYNEGHVLPIAIGLFTAAAMSDRSSNTIRLYSTNLDQFFQCSINDIPDNRPPWTSYVLGVIKEFETAGYPMQGKDIVVNTTIPIGSGLSSSAALEVSVATSIERLGGLTLKDEDIVKICSAADHKWVGINSGPMDQFASRACKAGYAGLLDCRTMKMTHHELPDSIKFLSIYSGIPRKLADSGYNDLVSDCKQATAVIKEKYPKVRSLRDADMAMLDDVGDLLEYNSYKRAHHVITEQHRVFQFIEAARKQEYLQFGVILREGHQSLSEDYEVSLPLLDEMVDWLYYEGVIGARLTGAGFGGSLVALVEREYDVKRLYQEFLKAFDHKVQETPKIWAMESVNGAAETGSIIPLY